MGITRIDESFLSNVILESVKRIIKESNELQYLAQAIASQLKGSEVFEGENEDVEIEVNGAIYNVYFYVECYKDVTKSWFKGDYYNPRDPDECHVKIVSVYDINVYTEDGDEITELKNNDLIAKTIVDTCYIDPSSCDWDDYEDDIYDE